MGVPSSETGLDKQQLTQLRKEARKLYKSTYHLKHADSYEFNYVYRKVNDKWQAELIDWEHFFQDRNYEYYKDLPDPFEIDPNCNFVPPLTKKWVE
ncbi:hypothetical protein AX14_010623 [Amanita brunnescens Koide BX004]|nr:hypothetical protein AX14_010623 [Amanita brunnescens Koide BX004]